MDRLVVPDERYAKIVKAANSGGYGYRSTTIMDSDLRHIGSIVPGMETWIVIDDPYCCTVLHVDHAGKISEAESEYHHNFNHPVDA